MTILAAATTAYLASCRPSRFLLAGANTNMTSSPSAAAKAAAATRIRHLSSPSSSLYSSSSSDMNGSSTSTSNAIPSTAKPLHPPKRVLLLRHGQALHNPRAEAARENGCSFDEFLRLMGEDDAFDAALTDLGENQAMEAGTQSHVKHALRNVEMTVSSPLSRALRTADLVHPPSDATLSPSASDSMPRRVCIEDFREINGMLLNAKRRPTSDLEEKFPRWCFQQIPSAEESWGLDLECKKACGERGYRGLLWVMQQQEDNILVVCHGGLLNLTLNENSKVVLLDGRKANGDDEQPRCITKRFGNCELREFIMTVWDSGDHADESEKEGVAPNGENVEPVITLEEVSMGMEGPFFLNDDANGDKEKLQIM